MSEIIPHANELDPKFAYLLEAPVADPDGLPAVIKYSRKEKEQYVASEKDGKATGWRAHYVDGKWVEQAAPPKKKKAPAKKKAAAKKKPAKKKAAAKKRTVVKKSGSEDAKSA